MKVRTYCITFLAFSFSQSFRVLFLSNKDQIKIKYRVDDLFLAIMDFLYLLFYAIGAFFHFSIVNRFNIRQTYLKFNILGTITGCFFAYFSLFYDGQLFTDENIENNFNKIILIVNISLFGFSQFVVWPLNLAMVSEYYKPKTDGAMIGLWSSAWEIGSILSLLVSNFMVVSLKVRWQVPVLLFAAANLTCTLMIYFFLKDPKYHLQTNSQFEVHNSRTDKNYEQKRLYNQISQIKDEQQSAQTKFFNFAKQILKSNQLILYLVINGLCSGFFFIFFYWLPIYMVQIGQKAISGYMTLIYQVFSIFGSFLIGFLHEQETKKPSRDPLTRVREFLYHQSPFICNGVNLIAMIIWILINKDIVVHGILIGVIGTFMGGLFNSMHSNDLFNYTKNDPLKTQMFAVLLLITNYLITAIVSIFIGLAIHFGQSWTISNQKKNRYNGLFYILILITCVNIVLLILKRFYEKSERKSEYAKLESAIENEKGQDQKI